MSDCPDCARSPVTDGERKCAVHMMREIQDGPSTIARLTRERDEARTQLKVESTWGSRFAQELHELIRDDGAPGENMVDIVRRIKDQRDAERKRAEEAEAVTKRVEERLADAERDKARAQQQRDEAWRRKEARRQAGP